MTSVGTQFDAHTFVQYRCAGCPGTVCDSLSQDHLCNVSFRRLLRRRHWWCLCVWGGERCSCSAKPHHRLPILPRLIPVWTWLLSSIDAMLVSLDPGCVSRCHTHDLAGPLSSLACSCRRHLVGKLLGNDSSQFSPHFTLFLLKLALRRSLSLSVFICLQNEVGNKPDVKGHRWWDEEAHIWCTHRMFAPGMNGIAVVSWEHYKETSLNYGRMFQCADSQLWILSPGSVLEGHVLHSWGHTQCPLGRLLCVLLEPIEQAACQGL